ncbi:unnamed protein product [Plutella xylostella]|uniref:Mannosyltransferase n=1 Tax=Plutella xylostella TaxID=51655 RepID=A0A8S4G948_PLUXY|nr:unnamed protein product [Plutella xylostella]
MLLKSNILKAISFKNPVQLPLSYWLLVCLRFLLTVVPQRGYLHPDEFFQNVEVIAGDIFGIDVSKTWEFDPQFPVRNILVPKLLVGPPLYLIRFINPYTKFYLNIDLKTPYYLLVIPRLFICLLSFINDYCLYRICVLYGQNYKNRLKIFATSYVVLVYCCRSFSNTFEMMFFSMLLLFVAECMSFSDKVIYHDEFLRQKYEQAKTPVEKVKLFKLQTHLPEHSLNRVIVLATLVVVGIFNRPTFVGFALSPIFFWLHRGLGSKVIGFKDFNFRIFTFILCGIPTFIVMVIVDSVYYGYLTLADVDSMQVNWDNWVVTPLNFLRYNMDKKNLTRHGLHSRWMHVAVNVPLLFNVLGAIAILHCLSNVYRFMRGQYSKLPRIQSITGLMLFSVTIPVAILSAFPHQEARFIIPILVPLVYLYGNHLQSNETDGPGYKKLKNYLLYTWYILNLLLTLFYGFIHQGGIYPFTNSLHYEIKSTYGMHTHVITTHSYSIPTYLLQLEDTKRIWTNRATGHKYRLSPSTFIMKFGSMPTKDLLETIDYVLTDAEMLLHKRQRKYRFYVATPCSLERDIELEATKYPYIKLVEAFSYYPHFCSEALPQFPSRSDRHCLEKTDILPELVDLNVIQRISCYMKRFCYKIYSVHTTSNT